MKTLKTFRMFESEEKDPNLERAIIKYAEHLQMTEADYASVNDHIDYIKRKLQEDKDGKFKQFLLAGKF